MKILRAVLKTMFCMLIIICTVIFAGVIYLDSSLSKDYKIKKGDTLNIDTIVPVTAVYNGSKLSQSRSTNSVGSELSVDLKAFGIIPFTTVNVRVVDELQVAVLGTPFGMKIYTQGVLVIDLTEVQTKTGVKNPAKEAGIKVGDYILSVNGKSITSNEDLSAVVENSGGRELDFKIQRGKSKKHIKFAPVLSEETKSYKIGIWIRDSSAGIGTLTFYSPATDVVCGLGHGICDEDTGNLLSVESGELVSAQIIGIEKGTSGSAGKLNGTFKYESIGDIDLNCTCGVYSVLDKHLKIGSLYEVALKQEVTDGAAQILCTTDGDKAEFYSCSIKIRTSAFLSDEQNMIVTITDPKLLEKTGGIVQGMSGSPIIQNGKLVGAVTHVLVDDPTKGYGIFAENMLETAQSVKEEKELKNAS